MPPPSCTFISGWDVMLLKVKIIQDVFFVLFEGTEVILPPTSPGLGDAEEDGAGWPILYSPCCTAYQLQHPDYPYDFTEVDNISSTRNFSINGIILYSSYIVCIIYYIYISWVRPCDSMRTCQPDGRNIRYHINRQKNILLAGNYCLDFLPFFYLKFDWSNYWGKYLFQN